MKDIEDFQLAAGEIGTLRGVEYRACDNAGGCAACDLHGDLCEHNDVKCYGIIFKSVEDEGIYAQENNCGYIALTNLTSTKTPVNIRAIARVEMLLRRHPSDAPNAQNAANSRIHYLGCEDFLNVRETESQINDLIFNALKASKC